MTNKISLIFNTCDKYESLWSGFFLLWNRYWPNFDAPIILNTETKNFSFANYIIKRPVFIQESPTWSERLYASLKQVDTPYVLLVLDDFYLKSPVDTETLDMCIAQMDKDESIKLFTFGWQPGKNKQCDFNDRFEERGAFAPYRVNAQIALWRVSYLQKIIKLYENPWEFELNGSFRSSIYGGRLFSLKKGAPLVFDYDWGFLIIRGQINRDVADYFEKNEGLSFSPSFRPIDIAEYNALSAEKSKKPARYLKYFSEMVLSLFKK